MGEFREFWFQFRRHRGALFGMIILLFVIMMAIMASFLFDHGPWDLVAQPFIQPSQSFDYPLGTDSMGRDILAGIFFGARVSFLIGFAAAFISIMLGVVIGACAGYYGSWVDDTLMRVTELFQTIPPFMLMIVIVAIFQPSIGVIIIAVGVTAWPQVARLVRGEFFSLRDRDFVQAGIAIGMSNLRIICTQILPNAVAPVIVMSSFIVARAILNEAALAFLGLGDPNVMSWGTIIGQGRLVIRTAEYISVIPGIAILLTVLSFNLLGDGLNDALNPRQKER